MQQKSPRTKSGNRSHEKSNSPPKVGEGSIALAAPPYGIDFVDPTAEVTQLQPGAGHGHAGTVNQTGLPDRLKSGLEQLSGFSLHDVQVHYNSPEPAQLQALAYTQGSEIHIGPGQERHLPHEAWHVVQQKQGRVQATTQLKGIALNNDSRLESEADAMGKIAARNAPQNRQAVKPNLLSDRNAASHPPQAIQRLAIPPGFFGGGANRLRNDKDATISVGNEMFGYGATVAANPWRTTVTWLAANNPGGAWVGDGDGVDAIVGPDHPQGGPPEGDGAHNASHQNTVAPNPPGGIWIGGHILNDNLGGPGNDVRNITVLSHNANVTHKNEVERFMKDEVNNNGNFIYYRARVVRGGVWGPIPGVTLDCRWNILGTDGQQFGPEYRVAINATTGAFVRNDQPAGPSPVPANMDIIRDSGPATDGHDFMFTPRPFMKAGRTSGDETQFPVVATHEINPSLMAQIRNHGIYGMLNTVRTELQLSIAGGVVWDNIGNDIAAAANLLVPAPNPALNLASVNAYAGLALAPRRHPISTLGGAEVLRIVMARIVPWVRAKI